MCHTSWWVRQAKHLACVCAILSFWWSSLTRLCRPATCLCQFTLELSVYSGITNSRTIYLLVILSHVQFPNSSWLCSILKKKKKHLFLSLSPLELRCGLAAFNSLSGSTRIQLYTHIKPYSRVFNSINGKAYFSVLLKLCLIYHIGFWGFCG